MTQTGFKPLPLIRFLTSLWLIDRCGWCTAEAEGRREGNLPPGLCWIMDLTRVADPGGPGADNGLEIIGFDTESAVSRVVGKSINLWIWIPSPGPMWEMWLKFDGAEIILERRSGFLKWEDKIKMRKLDYIFEKNSLFILKIKTNHILLELEPNWKKKIYHKKWPYFEIPMCLELLLAW